VNAWNRGSQNGIESVVDNVEKWAGSGETTV